MKKYLVLAGNIGAGKSTLVKMLADKIGFLPYYEPVSENPYLENFYKDMKAWAFHSQTFFLTHRVMSHRALMEEHCSVVQDRSIYEDAEVFARNLHEQGTMTDVDWATYSELYKTFTSLLPPPDLVVYIRASVPTLKKRIAKRGREFESNIPDEYLDGLNKLYEDWIENFKLSPILVIPGDKLDFVAESKALKEIIHNIMYILNGRQRFLFPYEL